MFPYWLEHLDTAGLLLVNTEWTSPFLDKLLPILRNRDTWIPFYILLAIGLGYRFRWKGLLMVAIIGATVGLTDQVSSALLKPAFGRDRPCKVEGLQDKLNVMVHCGNNKSFTSSHAANHTAIAMSMTLLFLRGRRWWIALAFLWAFAIGYAQIYVGVHYPLDILGGMLTGILVARLVHKVATVLGYKTLGSA